MLTATYYRVKVLAGKQDSERDAVAGNPWANGSMFWVLVLYNSQYWLLEIILRYCSVK